MKRVGLVGWRGMVGSVLMQRMREENDFADIDPVFFTTSQTGKPAPDVGKEGVPPLQDAFDIDILKGMDVILTCQGGDYTTEVTRSCVMQAGKVTGLMRHPPCVWWTTLSSFWTRLTV